MCPIETVKPFALMIAPVYVYLRRNEKFVSVKAPLDFFTPQELEKLKGLEMFFMPDFVDSVLPHRDLARRIKTILRWSPTDAEGTPGPAPFEKADAALRMIAPLWGAKFRIEPFFVCVFVNELCSLLPGDELVGAREKDFSLFERAIIVSAWMVFLSLHLGLADSKYLDALRLSSFRKVLGTDGGAGNVLTLDSRSDAGELFGVLGQILVGENLYQPLGEGFFGARHERIAQKITARIARVERDRLRGNSPLEGSIYGKKGFADG